MNVKALKDDVSIPEPNEPTEWVWGEVVSVDKGAKQIRVKYIDYETDAEKEAAFAFTSDAKFENIKSIDDINAGDNITIDYLVDKNGNNVVKSVSVEKDGSAAEDEGSPVLRSVPEDNTSNAGETPALY